MTLAPDRRALPTRPTVIYVDKRGQVPFRYVRLLTLGRFELALTWPKQATS